jgi:hypothetical protein
VVAVVVVVVGAGLIMRGFDITPALCSASPWLLTVGFSMANSVQYSKAYRIQLIFGSVVVVVAVAVVVVVVVAMAVVMVVAVSRSFNNRAKEEASHQRVVLNWTDGWL